MKKMNFTLQSSLEANDLSIQIPGEPRLDEIAIRVIKEDCPDFLIPFRIVNINNCLSFKYRLMPAIALAYYDQTMQKDDFVRMYLNLLTPFIKGRDWFLDYHNLCIDPQYIFLDRTTGKSFFLYIPDYSAGNSDEEILEFFKDTFGHSQISGDNAFQVRLFQYFAKNQVTLNGLYQIFLEESRRVGTGGHPENGRRGAGNFAGIRQESGTKREPSGTGMGAADTAAGNKTAEQKEAGASKIPDRNPASPANLFGQKPVSEIFGAKENGAKAAETSGRESGIGKLGSLVFGGGRGKKEKEDLPDGEAYREDARFSGSGEADEVVEALFGEHRKGSKKGPKEKTTSGRDIQSGGGAEKKKAGAFFSFGKKKEAGLKAAEVPFEQARTACPDTYAAKTSADVAAPYASAAAFFQGDSGGDGDQTEIADGISSEAGAFLDLIDSPIAGAPFRIELDFEKPYITIGRKSSDEIQPDVAFGRDFTRMGRRHARIEKRNGHYYVIDLGSANHTLLDGRILIPNQPYVLKDGGELTFTDSRPVRYRIHL